MARTYHCISTQSITYESNSPKKFIVERIISLRLIGKKIIAQMIREDKSDVIYQGPKQLLLTFEYCLERKCLTLDIPLKSATKFLQVIEHRYDWMEIAANMQTGKTKILNKEKIFKNWDKMQNRLLQDYTGITLDDYFKTLGEFSYPVNSGWPCMTQYTTLGLLFLNIPQHVNQNWERKREVYLSENDPVIEEQISFNKMLEDKQYFNVTGNFFVQDEHIIKRNCIMNKYEGEIIKRNTTFLPESVEIGINYQRDDYTIDWRFELYEQ